MGRLTIWYVLLLVGAFVFWNFKNMLKRSIQGVKYWKECQRKLKILLEKGYDKREALLEISRARHPELSEITHRTIVDKHPELNRLAPFIHDVLDFRPSYCPEYPVYGEKLTDAWALALLEHTTVSDNGRVSTNFTAADNDVDTHRRKLEQDQAIIAQTKAIEANPESPGVGRNYFLRGIAYYNKGQYDQAIDDYSNAIEHDAMFLGWIAKPGHIGWDDETRRQIQPNHETEEAFRLDVIKNTDQHQRYPFDYYYRASAYYAKGEYDKAILDYTKTIEIDPDVGIAHYFLAEAYLKTGDTDSALEHYEALKRLDENAANELHGLLQEHLTTQRNC